MDTADYVFAGISLGSAMTLLLWSIFGSISNADRVNFLENHTCKPIAAQVEIDTAGGER